MQCVSCFRFMAATAFHNHVLHFYKYIYKLVVSNEQKRQYPNEILTIYRIMLDLWDIMERYGQIFTNFWEELLKNN